MDMLKDDWRPDAERPLRPRTWAFVAVYVMVLAVVFGTLGYGMAHAVAPDHPALIAGH